MKQRTLFGVPSCLLWIYFLALLGLFCGVLGKLFFLVLREDRADESADENSTQNKQNGGDSNNPFSWREELRNLALFIKERDDESPYRVI